MTNWQARAEAAERNASKLDNDLEAADAALDDERREVARLQARAEAAERELETERELKEAEAERYYQCETTLAAVRAFREVVRGSGPAWIVTELDAILDGEGEK